ncbi:MAG: hypothetical protein LBS55_04100, partial [Prevotellaceae bacterium]|nr:hypothetical protein [Prevotellaceae bacterium]
MKVEKINLPHLHNDEWYGFHSEFHEKGEKFGPEALGIMDLWIPYGGHLDKADKSLLLIPKSVYTEKMKAVDKERDAILGSINRLVKEAHNLPDV